MRGQVIVQAYHSGHHAIQTAIQHHYEAFYEKEIRFRRIMKYPPFSVMANIIIQNKDMQRGAKFSRKVGQLLKRFSEEKVVVMGPSVAPLGKIRKNYRFQIVLKAKSRKDIKNIFNQFLRYAEKKKMPLKNIFIDVDPVSLM
jgi:primosomal protein N' (replication factor Y)